MQLKVFPTRAAMSAAAAAHVADRLRYMIRSRRRARIVPATAASQIEFQAALADQRDVDWNQVDVYQLDEYIGLPADHPARFEHLLRNNLLAPAGIRHAHLLSGHDADDVLRRASRAVTVGEIDLAILGIGENAHIAFNDPPADFTSEDPYLVVSLDAACRQQQVSEGWFKSIREVPRTAITMSIQQILRAREIVVIVPDARKAAAVAATLTEPVSPLVPATILRTHHDVLLFADEAAMSKTSEEIRRSFDT